MGPVRITGPALPPAMSVIPNANGIWSGGAYRQRQPGNGDHRPGTAVLDLLVFGYLDVTVALQQQPQCDSGLQPGKWSAEAEVDAVAEGQVRVELAVDIEPVGVGEHP